MRPAVPTTLRSAVMLAIAVLTAATVVGQDQSAIYLSVVDDKGTPVLELAPEDLAIREAAGPSRIVSVRRFGFPLRVTVLLDNGPRTADALVHYRTGLKKFFDGLPPTVRVSLIATAPNPRWLIRDTTDRLQIEKGISLITPDEGLGRFSDALGEYASRLDEEFRNVSAERGQPYLPVLVSIATTHQDGSDVRREANVRMITSLIRHRVVTTMIMVSPSRSAPPPGGLPVVEYDEGQNAEIAKAVQEATRGRYMPITGSGTNALSAKILPELASAIALRYIRQTTQHRVVLERSPGASGPMKDFALSLVNRPGARVIVSIDGNFP
jgi:hypothetical protein